MLFTECYRCGNSGARGSGTTAHSDILCVIQLDGCAPHSAPFMFARCGVAWAVVEIQRCCSVLTSCTLPWHADSHLQLLLCRFGWRPILLFWWIPTPSVAWRSVTYSVVIIPGKLCHFVLGYHQYFPLTKAVLRRTGLFHSRVLAAALSVSACHIDFPRNRQHCVLLRKCYIRGAMCPPSVV